MTSGLFARKRTEKASCESKKNVFPLYVDGGRSDEMNLVSFDFKGILIEHGKVGQKSGLNASFGIFLKAGIGSVFCKGIQRLLHGKCFFSRYACCSLVSFSRLLVTLHWIPAITSGSSTGQSEPFETRTPPSASVFQE